MPTNTPPEVESAEAAIAELLNAAGVGIAVVVEVTRLITVRDAALAAAVRRAALLEAINVCDEVRAELEHGPEENCEVCDGGASSLQTVAADLESRLRTLAEKAAP